MTGKGSNASIDNRFLAEMITPYFKDLFKDLSLRSMQKAIALNSEPIEKTLTKATFFEYCQLPGLVCDRFYSLFSGKDEESINEE
jgi:hypothetical protein